jgi:hypothetical protein
MLDRKSILAFTLVTAVALVGFCTFLLATRPGIGLYSDSTYYVDLARRLLSGHGYTVLDAYGISEPMPIFPFVYPTLLAGLGLLGIDLLLGARWLHAIIFAVNIFLAAGISFQNTSKSLGSSVLCAVVMMTSYDIFSYHTIALSEAPFLLFTLAGFLLLNRYLERPSWLTFVASAVATALALGTRYAGFAFIIAGGIAILFWERKRLARRVWDSVLFACTSCTLMLIWVLRNMRYNNGATGRHLNLHPPVDLAQFKELLFAASAWISNNSRSDTALYVWGPLVGGVAILIIISTWRRSFSREKPDLRFALPILYVLSYVTVLVFASVFLQADLFLDSLRILIPVHVFSLLLALTLGNDLFRRMKGLFGRVLVVTLCFASALWFLVEVADVARGDFDDGQEYAGSIYRDSELIRIVRSLPPGARLFSNLPWPIGLYTNRAWSLLPEKRDTATLSSDEYSEELRDFAQMLQEKNVFLAYFKHGDDWFAFPPIEEIQTLVPLRVLAETADGSLFVAAAQ